MPFHYEIVPSSISKPKLRLFYDTASPFSYLAAVVMMRYQDDANSPWKGKVEMEFVPSDLPEIRKRSDNWPGPPAIRKKARYLAQDMHRDRRTYRVSLIPNPKAFPAKTAESLLLLSHIKINYDHKVLQEATMVLFKAYWEDNQDPARDEVMESYVGPFVGGEDKVRTILAEIRKDGKVEQEWLNKWTTEAADAGAFGAPWLHGFRTEAANTVERQVFFGSDRFDHIADFFGLPWNGYVLDQNTPMPPHMDWPPSRKPKL